MKLVISLSVMSPIDTEMCRHTLYIIKSGSAELYLLEYTGLTFYMDLFVKKHL